MMNVTRKVQFNRNREAAKSNLTARLQRNPSAAEILGLVGVRRKGENENAFIAKVAQKAAERAEEAAQIRAAKAAAAAEVRSRLKPVKEVKPRLTTPEREEKSILAMLAREAKKNLKVMPRLTTPEREENAVIRMLKRESKKNNIGRPLLTKSETRAIKKAEKNAAKQAAKELFMGIEAQARRNLTDALGKAPRVANIRRLASIRHSGADLTVDDYLRIKDYKDKLKYRNTTRKNANNLYNFRPSMDPCAECEMKKFIESE
jgi:hypothetical protein